MLYFIKYFHLIYAEDHVVLIFHFVNVMYHVYEFLYGEPYWQSLK